MLTYRQLVILATLLLSGVAAGFLFLLFQGGKSFPVEKRVTDIAAETAAGHYRLGTAAQAPPQVVVDLEGEFLKFDGKAGKSSGSWTRFRGADFDNISKESVPLSERWPANGPTRLWSVPLGEGHSGAAVWKGAVYILDYDEAFQGDALRCFSLDSGKEIWQRRYHAPTKRNHGVSRTVPALTSEYVVTMGPRCFVLCVGTESGDFVWGLDLVKDYGAKVPLWYTGQCPLIDGDQVVLAPGGSVLMMGVDLATGSIEWTTPNDDQWEMSHSSVMSMNLLGKQTYVYCSKNGIVGVSAEAEDRGKLLWKSSSWSHSVLSPSPVAVASDKIFLTAGYGGGSMMLGLKKENGEFKAEPIFELEKTTFGCEQQTPIFYQDHLFAVLPKDAGALREQFVCMDTDGKIKWSSGKTERFGLGPFIMADGKIFILNDNGDLTMIRASIDGYEKLGVSEVVPGHDAWAPMALVDGKLLLRDSKLLVCLDVSAGGSGSLLTSIDN